MCSQSGNDVFDRGHMLVQILVFISDFALHHSSISTEDRDWSKSEHNCFIIAPRTTFMCKTSLGIPRFAASSLFLQVQVGRTRLSGAYPRSDPLCLPIRHMLSIFPLPSTWVYDCHSIRLPILQCDFVDSAVLTSRAV